MSSEVTGTIWVGLVSVKAALLRTADAVEAGGAVARPFADVDELTQHLASSEKVPPLCAVVDVDDASAQQHIAALRGDPRFQQVLVLARCAHASERDFLHAMSRGADDAMAREDLGGLTRRVANLVSVAPIPLLETSDWALIADEQVERRRLHGRALRAAGFAIQFAESADELARFLEERDDFRVVVVSETLSDAVRNAHEWVRARSHRRLLPVVVIEGARKGERGAHRVEKTAWLPPDAPGENLVFVVNELLNPQLREQRASPRILFSTLCAFRRAGDLAPSYGVTYNISRDGIFVRTLDPPKRGETVWLELRPPGAMGAVHIRGTVAWCGLPGSRGGYAPGFALQILPPLCPSEDLARYRERYTTFLGGPRDYRIDDLEQAADALGTANAGTKVLAVDDDNDVLETTRRVLSKHGIDVATACDGREALHQFNATRFDAVVVDLNIPGLHGIELLKAIREADDSTPVLIHTGEPSTQTAVAALDHGAIRYLIKPVGAQLLLDAVNQAVRVGRLARFRREAARVVSTEADPTGGDELDKALTRAIDQLFLHYQPIVSLRDRRTVAYEALARSKEPTLAHPGRLFDAAERLGRLSQLATRVRELAPVAIEGRAERLFVNVHTSELMDEGLYDAAAPLSKIARRVVLEITERARLDSVPDLRARVERLRTLGFQLAVDDLGAGYSGLSAFCALQPEVAKLDISLVRHIDSFVMKQRLVRSLSDTCRDLGITLVAEGIETVQELITLEALGCDLVQGFFFARPGLPPPEIEVPPHWR